MRARKPVVAIDGPAGAGKSTLARRIAEQLGVAYLNTGLMYRALARAALREGIDVADAQDLARRARELTFSIDEREAPPTLRIDGAIPGPELSSTEVEAVVSTVSAHPEVRSVLRAEQRRLAESGAVVEGRDIGTVVFPDADVKIMLHADPTERAARRQAERGTRDPHLVDALARRDALDARVNPLVPAEDATPLETTGRDADDVFTEAMAIVRVALEHR